MLEEEEEVNFIPYVRDMYEEEEMKERSKSFWEFLDKRRTVREFSDKPVPREIIENIIMAASTAPSGAHKQPWTFCVISNPEVKKKIREAAEEEEKVNYNGRMSDEWLKDLEPFATNEHKPFLEIAPYLIVMFKRVFETEEDKKKNNYYVNESVGLAGGILLTAIHNAGLVALTHTPSPMNFLSKVLDRPANERAFLLIPVGYPIDNVTVPDLSRKGKEDVIVYYD